MVKVYAVWFTDYDDAHIEGNLYRSRQKAEQMCEMLNKWYEKHMAEAGFPGRVNWYSVEEHTIE